MTLRSLRIATIAGDGVGPEVTAEAKKAVDTAGGAFGFKSEWLDFPFGGVHYLETGEVLPDEAIQEIARCDALLLGAIGRPEVKPGILERGILLALRFYFDQYINLRPSRSLPGVGTPMPFRNFDIVVVRENTEDFYMGIGGRSDGTPLESSFPIRRGLYSGEGNLYLSFDRPMACAAQVGLATEPAVRRSTAWACDKARQRGEDRVTLASKSNALPIIYGFWEDVAADEAKKKSMALEVVNVDALCYHLCREPERYGVILTPNMFGDIVSDLLAGLAGGLGTAAGANIGDGLSMFEPVHGSAPDIAGTGRSNPVAAALSASLMLEHLGEVEAAKAIERAVLDYLSEGGDALPIELGGKATTTAAGDSIAAGIRARKG
ncbi:MAG: 3-isopropylmalate dehydrogenase [Synergistetes bacterium ADurb.Bin155]|jgi:3-isopropylmalate dehydrogenase|nr:isocitrate/isopropylmalate dehydrogenase family protein [Synergistales bacterium]NMD18018.1 isocitrate/isopropylmalate dehydrogenase family protein [Synergistaceae bacterium]OQB46814.1 MAG: 3-isopropylmalate dehydrogenase [Synergistetes bacterium ADurb.Bin155]MBP8995542.1 isocitrate/isopropylmalate dehydrogenase family protein [Synergistales bacterium]HOC81640.1 isocitrate/isopropylmalate family dehydrogenase [Synergistales bacterium]